MRNLVLLPIANLLFTLLFGGGFWEKKPFLEWSREEVTRMLTRSPWAAIQSVRRSDSYMGEHRITKDDLPCPFDCGPGPAAPQDVFGPGGSIEPEATENPWKTETAADVLRKAQPVSRYTIRFITAAPIRMAQARYLLLNGQISHEQALEYLENSGFGDRIVVAVGNLDEDLREFEEPEESLREKVCLILKESKRRLDFEQYLSPSQAGKLEAYFVFPGIVGGKPIVTLAEKEVRFVCRLSSQTKIEKSFKLKNMLYKEELEL